MQCFPKENLSSSMNAKGSESFCSCSQVGSVEVGREGGSGKFNLSISNALLKAKFRKTPPSLIFPWQPPSTNKNL